MPGLGTIPEDHTLLDSLVDQLAIEVDLFYENFNQPEARQFCYDNKISNKMRFLLSRLHVEYSIDYLATPLNVKTKVWSESRGFGQVAWDYTLTIWNLADPSLIYVANHKEGFSPSGEERVDRNIFNKAKSKWISDWTYLRSHLKEECAKEDR